MKTIKTLAAALLVSVLAACGGGGDSGGTTGAGDTVLLDETRTLTGGTLASALYSGFDVTVNDVRFTVPKAATVTVCLDVTWQQTLKKPVGLTLRYTSSGQPVSFKASTAGATGSANVLPLSGCYEFSTTGAQNLTAATTLNLGTDCNACVDALGAYTATAHWRVTAR